MPWAVCSNEWFGLTWPERKETDMKMILGLALMAAGIALGLWAGIWWAFIGGIVDVIREIRAPELDAMSVAVGIAKVIFAGLIGWLAAALALLPGYALVKSA